jgi:hypothetical protein
MRAKRSSHTADNFEKLVFVKDPNHLAFSGIKKKIAEQRIADYEKIAVPISAYVFGTIQKVKYKLFNL